MIDKNSYVRIRKTLLKPEERASNIPAETKEVPFKMWVKGYLHDESDLFDIVKITTETGRVETGRLKEAFPPYKIGYGDFVPEILKLIHLIKSEMYGDKDE